MSNLEALKSIIHFPITDYAIEKALLDRGIAVTGYADADKYVIGNKQAVDLAYADLIVTLVSAPNVSEGGYSVSLSDKASLIKSASAIYAKYGVENPLSPSATFVQRW